MKKNLNNFQLLSKIEESEKNSVKKKKKKNKQSTQKKNNGFISKNKSSHNDQSAEELFMWNDYGPCKGLTLAPVIVDSRNKEAFNLLLNTKVE